MFLFFLLLFGLSTNLGGQRQTAALSINDAIKQNGGDDTKPASKVNPYWEELLHSSADGVGEWAVEVDGNEDEAKKVADTSGCRLVRKMRSLDDIFIFQERRRRNKRSVTEVVEELLAQEKVKWAEHLERRPRNKRSFKFNDPLLPYQWQLNETRSNMRIAEAWEDGWTGRGVLVGILDDGIDYRHPDLFDAYDSRASFDFIRNIADAAPTNEVASHGTRCAGVVAMRANNSACGVGVAYNAKIAGLRMLDKTIDDAVEGDALAYALEKIDVFSASWGPADDGKSVEGPGKLAQRAIHKAVTQGRNGLGSVFVWASGNGGLNEDDCNLDGYSSSPFTISVGVVAENGKKPWYGESCASILTSVYTSGNESKEMTVSTDVGDSCTTSFVGSSAAAPIVAGVVALALEANPHLIWRDIQHLLVLTSDAKQLMTGETHGFVRNAAGFFVSRDFGFGVVDAKAMTSLAQKWKTVPQLHICTQHIELFEGEFGSGKPLKLHFNHTACQKSPAAVNFIEHAVLVVTVEAEDRGQLEIYLTSPQGTRVQLLHVRPLDRSSEGLKEWPLASVHHWGESPVGVWTLEIEDHGTLTSGRLVTASLRIHGTSEAPTYYNLKAMKEIDVEEQQKIQERPKKLSTVELEKQLEELEKQIGDLTNSVERHLVPRKR